MNGLKNRINNKHVEVPKIYKMNLISIYNHTKYNLPTHPEDKFNKQVSVPIAFWLKVINGKKITIKITGGIWLYL